MLAEGVSTPDACDAFLIRPNIYRAAMRQSPALREQVEAARADWDNRNWPEEKIEEILAGVAGGESLTKVAQRMEFEASAFHSLRLRDPYVNELYTVARQIQAEGYVDEIIELSDGMEHDIVADGKGGMRSNGAAVQRSRLQADSRKWVASKLLIEVYGDKLEVAADMTVTHDHAERLDSARQRLEKAHEVVAKRIIETTAVEIPEVAGV